jgi:hypothetical protein
VVRTPLIIGETVTGRREIIGDRGMFVRNDRYYYRHDDRMYRTGRTIKRAPEAIAESLDHDHAKPYMFRKDGRTLLGRGPGDELFED